MKSRSGGLTNKTVVGNREEEKEGVCWGEGNVVAAHGHCQSSGFNVSHLRGVSHSEVSTVTGEPTVMVTMRRKALVGSSRPSRFTSTKSGKHTRSWPLPSSSR
mmetsp:Transcript_28673/g.58607  ORF Transcript_28673/g.58607 Transcript_28673/m.58607 type:complete len:103 (+) Transcript_28673:392-700(+)